MSERETGEGAKCFFPARNEVSRATERSWPRNFTLFTVSMSGDRVVRLVVPRGWMVAGDLGGLAVISRDFRSVAVVHGGSERGNGFTVVGIVGRWWYVYESVCLGLRCDWLN